LKNAIEIVARLLIKIFIPIYFLGLITWGAIQEFEIKRDRVKFDVMKLMIENGAEIHAVPQSSGSVI